jgi:hypothetical protein
LEVKVTDVAICAIFKDERKFLLEWIAYHKMIGFDRFVLYDNGSTDGGREAILETAARDFVDIIDWPERPGQLSAYGHFCANFAKDYDWVAFLDLDEFVHLLIDDAIKQLLTRSGDHNAMLINWLNFGPSGHVVSPTGLVIGNYTFRLPEGSAINRHVKSVVRTTALIGAGGTPHVPTFRGDACHPGGDTIGKDPIQPQAFHDVAVINHYYTRSWEDWCHKSKRGRAQVLLEYKVELFAIHQRHATVEDQRITKYRRGIQNLLWEMANPPRYRENRGVAAASGPPAMPDEGAAPYPSLPRAHTVDEAERIYSAQTILGVVRERVSFASVLDVGCGRGMWLAAASRMGAGRVVGVADRGALSKDLYCDPSWIRPHDLERRFDLGERFDLVLSLEVAEHLKPSAAEGFVRSLARHGDLILFSAAIPHQGGVSHLNEQFADYWAELFAKAGFLPVNIVRRRIWNDNGIKLGLRQNVLLYASVNYVSCNHWANDALLGSGPIALVHPQIYLQRCGAGARGP